MEVIDYFVTEKLGQGFSFDEISVMVGTSPQVLRQTYGHWSTEGQDRIDQKQSQIWLSMGLDANGNPLPPPTVQ
jgi:hypothetical protein